jgi:hypothetical protein
MVGAMSETMLMYTLVAAAACAPTAFVLRAAKTASGGDLVLSSIVLATAWPLWLPALLVWFAVRGRDGKLTRRYRGLR